MNTLFLTAFSLALSTGKQQTMTALGSLSEVYENIDRLIEEINAAHAQHSDMFNRQQKNCEEEMKYRERDLSNAQFYLDKATSEFENCQSQYNSANAALERAENGALRELLGLAETIRSSAASTNREDIEQHRKLIHFSEEFLGEAEGKDQIEQLISLLITQSQLNQDKYQELQLQTMNKLEETINQLKGNIGKAQARAGPLRTLAVSMEECRKQQENKIFQGSDTKFRNANLYRSTAVLCNDWKEQFELQSSSSGEELQLLDELGALLRERYGGSTSTSKSRAAEYKEEWDNFQNSYVFRGQDGFQRLSS